MSDATSQLATPYRPPAARPPAPQPATSASNSRTSLMEKLEFVGTQGERLRRLLDSLETLAGKLGGPVPQIPSAVQSKPGGVPVDAHSILDAHAEQLRDLLGSCEMRVSMLHELVG